MKPELNHEEKDYRLCPRLMFTFLTCLESRPEHSVSEDVGKAARCRLLRGEKKRRLLSGNARGTGSLQGSVFVVRSPPTTLPTTQNLEKRVGTFKTARVPPVARRERVALAPQKTCVMLLYLQILVTFPFKKWRMFVAPSGEGETRYVESV